MLKKKCIYNIYVFIKNYIYTQNINIYIYFKKIKKDDIYDQFCVALNISVYRSFKITVVLVFGNFFFTLLLYKVA